MVEVTYSYKNREFFQLEDSLINQLAEHGKSLLFALLEPIQEVLLNEEGKIKIILDERPNIELIGFSAHIRNRIEKTWRGEDDLYDWN
ncbi:hypothetical protein LX64_01807 [Chitinophaga skermanii]|uniref:Uncharacterized protein n=1 Tax=Chitinophaga skermanii TaxID=331697 RepID=A0A327QQR6_9BACT|nr:hypothetical protein [Chitinophaga skermanii]RAJ06680.1 hypothetical protein LX64_01807 [Chitinophaga skermanii]